MRNKAAFQFYKTAFFMNAINEQIIFRVRNMRKYSFHFFICENKRPDGHPRGSCADKGSVEIRELLKKKVHEAGLRDSVRINASGCLDACKEGPVFVVYPEGIWYGPVTVSDLDEIFDQHILNGRPVERLFLK